MAIASVRKIIQLCLLAMLSGLSLTAWSKQDCISVWRAIIKESSISSALKLSGHTKKYPAPKKWYEQASRELHDVVQTLREIIDERQLQDDHANADRYEHLKSRLAGVDSFAIEFYFNPDQKNELNATILAEYDVVHLTPGFMDERISPIVRQVILAHEIGHLISVPSYIGHNGTALFGPGDGKIFEQEFRQGKGTKFVPFTFDNYPFLPDLRKCYAQSLKQKGKPYHCTGLDYIGSTLDPLEVAQYDPEKAARIIKERDKIREVIDKYATLVRNNFDESTWGGWRKLQNKFQEESDNFETEKINLALYLSGSLREVMTAGIYSRIRDWKDMLIKGIKGSRTFEDVLTLLNSRIDEVTADLFARMYLEKRILMAKDAKERSILAKDFYDFAFVDRKWDLENDIYDEHPSWMARWEFFLQSEVFKEEVRRIGVQVD